MAFTVQPWLKLALAWVRSQQVGGVSGITDHYWRHFVLDSVECFFLCTHDLPKWQAVKICIDEAQLIPVWRLLCGPLSSRHRTWWSSVSLTLVHFQTKGKRSEPSVCCAPVQDTLRIVDTTRPGHPHIVFLRKEQEAHYMGQNLMTVKLIARHGELMMMKRNILKMMSNFCKGTARTNMAKT